MHPLKSADELNDPAATTAAAVTTTVGGSTGDFGPPDPPVSLDFEPFQIMAFEKHNEFRALHQDTNPVTLDAQLCRQAQVCYKIK